MLPQPTPKTASFCIGVIRDLIWKCDPAQYSFPGQSLLGFPHHNTTTTTTTNNATTTTTTGAVPSSSPSSSSRPITPKTIFGQFLPPSFPAKNKKRLTKQPSPLTPPDQVLVHMLAKLIWEFSIPVLVWFVVLIVLLVMAAAAVPVALALEGLRACGAPVDEAGRWVEACWDETRAEVERWWAGSPPGAALCGVLVAVDDGLGYLEREAERIRWVLGAVREAVRHWAGR